MTQNTVNQLSARVSLGFHILGCPVTAFHVLVNHQKVVKLNSAFEPPAKHGSESDWTGVGRRCEILSYIISNLFTQKAESMLVKGKSVSQPCVSLPHRLRESV